MKNIYTNCYNQFVLYLLFFPFFSISQSTFSDPAIRGRYTTILQVKGQEERLHEFLLLGRELLETNSSDILTVAIIMDSLAKTAKNDTMQILALYLRGRGLQRIGDMTSSLHYLKASYKKATATEYKVGISRSSGFLSYHYYLVSKLDSAMFFADTSIHYSSMIDDRKATAFGLENKGITLLAKGDVEKALSVFLYVLSMYEEMEDTSSVIRTHYNISICYYFLKNMEKSNLHLKTSIKLIDENKGELSGNIYRMMGEIKIEQLQLDSAVYFLEKGIDIYIDGGFEYQLPLAYNSLANAFLKIGQLKTSRRYLEKAIEIVEQIDLPQYWPPLNIMNGTLLLKEGKYAESIPFLLSAFEHADSSANLKMIMDASQILSEAYELSGDLNQALIYFKKYKKSEGEFLSIEKINAVKELELKYQKDADLKIAVEKTENEQRKRKIVTIWLIIAIIGLLCLIVLSILLRKANSQLNTARDYSKFLLEEMASSVTEIQDVSEVEITLNENYDEFGADKQKILLESLKEILELSGQIQISKVSKGSVILTLELKNEEEAIKLLIAAKNGDLKNFGISGALLKKFHEVRNVENLNIDMKFINDFKKELKLSSSKNIELGFEKLKNNIKSNAKKFDELMAVTSQFNRLKYRIRKNLISEKEYSIETSKVFNNFIELINTLEESDFK